MTSAAFAVTRNAFDADFLRVHGGIGFEIIQSARRAPGPRAQRAPVIRLARLAFVDEADDAFRQSRAVVGLNAVGTDRRVTPARGDELFGRGRAGIRAAASTERAEAIRGRGFAGASRKVPPNATEHHQHRHGTFGVRGSDQGHLNVHLDRRAGRVVHVADELFRDDRNLADHAIRRLRCDRPRDFRNILRHAAKDFALEVLDDFRAALLPPLLRRRDLLPALQRERIGQVGNGLALAGS